MKKLPNYIIALSLLILPFAAVEANTVVRTGDSVSVGNDQSITGDFYTLSSVVNVSGEVDGDFIALSGSPTVNGIITEDALVIGGNVDIHGPIGDDLRVIGGKVIVAGEVTGDVFVIGGTLVVLSTASIGGDLLVYGGEVEVNGPVNGDVLGNIGSLRIDAPVGGGVEVAVDELTLGDKAVVEEAVSYTSISQITRSPNATVNGEIIRNDPVLEASDVSGSVQPLVVFLLIVLFSTAVWYLFSRKSLSTLSATAITLKARTFLIGLAVLFLTPFVITVLGVSLLGSFIALLILLGYLLLLLLALLVTPVAIGRFAEKTYKKDVQPLSLLTLVIGVLISVLILLVPVIGLLVLLVVMVFSVGALFESLIKLNIK